MTDAKKAARAAGIREAAAVVSKCTWGDYWNHEGELVDPSELSHTILALLDSAPAPAGVTVPDELYQAAKRDAEEAEAYAAELEAKLQDMALDYLAAQGQAEEAYQAQLVALDALELADAALSGANMNMRVVEQRVKAAIAELKALRGASA